MQITRSILLQIAVKVALAAAAITPSVGAAQLLMIPFDLLATAKTNTPNAQSLDRAEIAGTSSAFTQVPRQ